MKPKKEYWITPPDIYEKLDQEFHFDFDPCPYPHKEGFNGINVEWGQSNYVNPPFRKSDGKYGAGPTAFIRKAIEENRKGKTCVIMINTNAFINMLIEAGAEMRSMKRVKWLDGRTREPWKSPSNTTCFILRGRRPNMDKIREAVSILEKRLRYIDNPNYAPCGLHRNEKEIRGVKVALSTLTDVIEGRLVKPMERGDFRTIMCEYKPHIAEDSGLSEWTQSELDKAYDDLMGNGPYSQLLNKVGKPIDPASPYGDDEGDR